MRRHLLTFAFVILVVVPGFAQERTVWKTGADIVEGVSGTIVGTAVDVDEARNQIQLAADNDRYSHITIVTDSVSTQYNGFGDVINGKPEIFVGSKGFSNVRNGDRLEIRGVGRSSGVLRADYITLLGRTVSAPQTGVGDTRSPSTGVSTPTVGRSNVPAYGRIEGVIRQVNASDNRIVIETDRREILNIRVSSTTPVFYRGDNYRVSNLEIGDRVRIESDSATTSDRDIRARTIEVTESVQEGGGTARAQVSSITGRVTRVDRTSDVARVDTGRGEVRVDMSRAYDASGRRVRAADLQVGDRVEISGSYGLSSDIFAASTVRFGEENVFSGDTEPRTQPVNLGLVTITGTVSETLDAAANLGIKDRTGRVIPVYVSDDFVVRTKAGGYTTADHLNVNDPVLVKAYRDSDGNYIAQTIRIR